MDSVSVQNAAIMRALTRLPARPQPPLQLAISECLTGSRVRYDGGHRRSSIPHHALDDLFEYLPICPEVGIGMSVPRDPIHLVARSAGVRAISVIDGRLDVTERLQAYAGIRLPDLAEIDGYLFMRNSPSCGLFGVSVTSDAGDEPQASGRGVFAQEITRRRPSLPVEESGRLDDAGVRGNFVTRTFVHAHIRSLLREGVDRERLAAFHVCCRVLVTARRTSGYQMLASLLADQAGDVSQTADRYFTALMQILCSLPLVAERPVRTDWPGTLYLARDLT